MRLIDSHTGGEPTRVVVSGGPALGGGPLDAQQRRLQAEFDDVRTTIILEPRGAEAMVGALLCDPVSEDAAAGVIYFNNTGYLGMCGHGTIGLAVTLHHLGRIGLGKHRIDTSVGSVEVDLIEANKVRIENVPSFRHAADVTVEVAGVGAVSGSIAWGGNWFFLAESAPMELSQDNIPELTAAASQVMQALADSGITGKDGAPIDHVEFFGPPESSGANSRNFVLCPGGAYDRSPCGTGTSAKVACLAAQGKLAPGEVWVQESIIGSRFEASYRLDDDGQIVPSILGTAYVTGETEVIRQDDDPFRNGIQ